MSASEQIFRVRILVLALFLFGASCGPTGDPSANAGLPKLGGVTPVGMDAPLRSPLYADTAEALFALQTDGSSLVKFKTDDAFAEIAAEELQEAGANMTLDPRPEKLYVPQPELGRILALDAEEMRKVETFAAGSPPARVALEPRGAGTLFTLSKSGRTVAAVDLAGLEVVAETEVAVSEATLLDTYRGFDDFRVWVAGTGGVAFHGGPSLEPRAKAQIEAVSLAVGTGAVKRAYVGESDSGHVLALEPGPGGELEIVAETDVRAEARYLVPEGDRLYAATHKELVALDGDNLKPIASVDLEPTVEEASIEDANLSGLAVGDERVYLTLESEPYVLLVEKP